MTQETLPDGLLVLQKDAHVSAAQCYYVRNSLITAILIKSDNTNMRPGPSGSAVDLGDTCRARDDGRLRRGWGYKGHRRSMLFHRSSTSRPHDTRGP